jgi:hypothetical protein
VISFLCWRLRDASDRLEVGEEDVKALVENMLRSTLNRSDALLASRLLRRNGDSWLPHLTIQLTGTIENARLPGGLRDRLRDESRIREVSICFPHCKAYEQHGMRRHRECVHRAQLNMETQGFVFESA